MTGRTRVPVGVALRALDDPDVWAALFAEDRARLAARPARSAAMPEPTADRSTWRSPPRARIVLTPMSPRGRQH